MTVATSVPAANAAKSTKRPWSRTVLVLLAAGLIACSCSQSATSTKGTIGPHTSTPVNATAALHARPSPGCTAPTRSEVTLARRTVTVDGTQRWFLISTPPGASATRPTPVVFDFHGLG